MRFIPPVNFRHIYKHGRYTPWPLLPIILMKVCPLYLPETQWAIVWTMYQREVPYPPMSCRVPSTAMQTSVDSPLTVMDSYSQWMDRYIIKTNFRSYLQYFYLCILKRKKNLQSVPQVLKTLLTAQVWHIFKQLAPVWKSQLSSKLLSNFFSLECALILENFIECPSPGHIFKQLALHLLKKGSFFVSLKFSLKVTFKLFSLEYRYALIPETYRLPKFDTVGTCSKSQLFCFLKFMLKVLNTPQELRYKLFEF